MNFDFAKLERRIAALEANRGASLRFGTVTEVNEKNGSARVQLPDGQGMVSMPLRVLQPRTLKDQHQRLPDIGEPVAVLFAGQGFEQGVILGAHYSTKTPAPGQPATHDYTIYEDGTELCYDRTAHKLTAKVKGDVEVETEGNISATAQGEINAESAKGITLKAPFINLAGMLRVTDKNGQAGAGELIGTYLVRQGSLHVPNGDVLAGAVSLINHSHGGVESGSSTTDMPVGGGTDGGTGGGESELNHTAMYEEYFTAMYKEPPVNSTKKDRLLLCIPAIAQQEAEDSWADNDKIGWLQLRAMLHKWFTGAPNEDAESSPEVFWVDMNWIRSYWRANVTYNTLIKHENLFTYKGKRELAKQLHQHGYFGETETDFDYTQPSKKPLFGKQPWKEWKESYFQQAIANYEGSNIPDGLTCCMGTFNFRVLAAGYTKPLPNGEYQITVKRISVFVWDSFNFDGKDDLGYWSCEDKSFSNSGIPWNDTYDFIYNKDFHKFRESHDKGHDFMVLSEPQNVDGFEEFQYDTTS